MLFLYIFSYIIINKFFLLHIINKIFKEIDIYIYKQYKMDYKNGKIYTIRSYQTDDIYIGSTTQTLTKRLSKHKSDFKRWKKGTYHYVTSYELIKYNDVYIELLELCPCSNKMELFRREGELIRSMDCINKNVNGRTDKERKEYIKEYKKEYYQENKEKLKIQMKEYKKENKEKIKEYLEANKKKLKEKFTCACGGKYIYYHKSQHFKTKKHLKFVNQV
jgi:hypothetical protein